MERGHPVGDRVYRGASKRGWQSAGWSGAWLMVQ